MLRLAIFAAVFLASLSSSTARFEDFRCKCICPSLEVVNATPTGRMVYIEPVQPNECNCEKVVKPPADKVKLFCPRCECRYETRNTKTIQVVIIIIICVVSMLVVYMIFLLCLDPLMGRKSASYAEQRDEDVDESAAADREAAAAAAAAAAEAGARGGDGVPLARRRPDAAKTVLSRVGQQQDKWKQQVQEQRHAVFDRQTMLN